LAEELIIQCDSQGNILGPISKLKAHAEGFREKHTHYATWSMIFSTSRKYGIQLKNPKKHDKHGAGKWDMGVAGHNCYVSKNSILNPMDFSETLLKEAQEEVGLNVKVITSLKEFVQLAKIYLTSSSSSSSSKKVQQPDIQQPIAFFFEKFHYQTEINNEYVGLAFILTPTTELEFKDQEVVDFQWLSPSELSAFLKENKNYCSPLPLVFKKAEKFRKKYLQ